MQMRENFQRGKRKRDENVFPRLGEASPPRFSRARRRGRKYPLFFIVTRVKRRNDLYPYRYIRRPSDIKTINIYTT